MGALIDAGADLDAADAVGLTALHYAAGKYWDGGATAALLLKSGANVNALTLRGSTPLHAAIDWTCPARPQAAELLLRHGANALFDGGLSGSCISLLQCEMRRPKPDSAELRRVFDAAGFAQMATAKPGTGLWFISSLLNHDKDPSCGHRNIGGLKVITASRPIAQGDELTISYCDDPVALQKHWGITID